LATGRRVLGCRVCQRGQKGIASDALPRCVKLTELDCRALLAPSSKLLAELLPQWLIIATGSVLVFFSAFGFGAGRHLDPGVPPRADVFRIPPWILIAVNGFLALVALAALLGIWFGRANTVPG
jgi:hypothetical protein